MRNANDEAQKGSVKEKKKRRELVESDKSWNQGSNGSSQNDN